MVRKAVVAVGFTLGACASGGGPVLVASDAGGKSLATASLPEALASVGNTPSLAGTPTDVYSRIAQRALNCWFGAGGPLKPTHVFAAEAPPPSAGAGAEIVIHERDQQIGQNPRGTRAFRIIMTRKSDTSTRLTLQVGKLAADLAQAMEKDVLAWGFDKDSCAARIARPPPPPPPVVDKKKPKKRAVTASR